jgi:hypothetical protein
MLHCTRVSTLRFCKFALVLALSSLGIAQPAWGQASTATVYGSVVDSTEAVIPGASITLENTATGTIRKSASNRSGQFALPSLDPGSYALRVKKQGFAVSEVTSLVLNVGDNVSLNIKLNVGKATETVTVDGSGQQINTTDASVSTVIDRKYVENIPLNGRSFQDLISMTPGVLTQSPQTSQSIGYNGDFSVNGQRTESNYYTVDGVSANANAGTGSGGPQAAVSGSVSSSTALGTTQSLISVDALQEFRVESSTYSAEYGRNPGAQFVLATRSGTSSFHGSIFDYLRNDFFDANNWFNDHYGAPKPALRQNDFGGTIGGPIPLPWARNHNSTFFFGSYEGLRLTQPQPAAIQYVPDIFMRSQAPLALQPILDAFPIQNGIDYGSTASPNLAQFIKAYSLPSQIDSTSVRIDHATGQKLVVFFRFGDTPSYADSRNLSSLTTTHNDVQTYTLGLDSQLTNQLSESFRLGYTASMTNSVATLDSFGGATTINMAQTVGVGGYANPEALVELYFPSIGVSNLAIENPVNRERQWNLTDTIRWEIGRHLLSLGIDYRRIRSPLTPASPTAVGVFETPQAVLTNAATYSEVVKYGDATPIFNETSAFAQDEWHIAKTINLSLGLRWELDPPPGAEGGQTPYTLSGNINDPSSLTLAPKGTPLWKTTWYNFAPRLGIAWTAHANPGWETVVRAGGGAFFDTANELAIDGYDGVGYLAYNLYFGSSLPITGSQLNFSPSTTPPYSEVYAFPTHLQLPYTLQWNVSLEQALSKEQSLTLSYVGSNGRRLIQQQELEVAQYNPNFDYIFYTANGVTSNYQALQVKFQRSVAKNIQALASYTWSHSLDFGSNNIALPLTRGNSDFDVRNNFQGGLSWKLPETKRTIEGAFVNHWGVDARIMARSGFPVTLEGNQLINPANGSTYFNNVNLVPNEPIYLNGSQYPGGRAINPAAFSVPTVTTPGNAPRNFVRGFGASQLNLSARRNFALHDKAVLQFRAESFDILNHPNFGYIDPYFTDATFGQATKTLDQSLGTVASQYQQGGARSLQFALKLTF